MKKMSPDTACGLEPSMGVSMWVMPLALSAAATFTVTSGLTVEQSQVMSPGRPPSATLPASR